jgi:hypothetical protein
MYDYQSKGTHSYNDTEHVIDLHCKKNDKKATQWLD